MKRILFLLLLTVSVYGQNPSRFAKIQITGNTNSGTATKVNVQEADGVINTIDKNDLINVVEVNDVPSLPLVGNAGKIYVVKNINKIYRWNGTFYQELAGSNLNYQSIIDALTFTPENVANKATDFTTVNNTLYPSVQAVNNLIINETTGSFTNIQVLIDNACEGSTISLKPNAVYTQKDALIIKEGITINGNGATLKRDEEQTTTLTSPATMVSTSITVAAIPSWLKVGDRIQLYTDNTVLTSSRAVPVLSIVGLTINLEYAIPHANNPSYTWPIGTTVRKVYEQISTPFTPTWVSIPTTYTVNNLILDGNYTQNTGNYYWAVNSAVFNNGKSIFNKCRFLNMPNENVVGHGFSLKNCYAENLNGSFIHQSANILQGEDVLGGEISGNTTVNTNIQPTPSVTGHSEGVICFSFSSGRVSIHGNRFLGGGEAVLGIIASSINSIDGANKNLIFNDNYAENFTKVVSSFNYFSVGFVTNADNISISNNIFSNCGSNDWATYASNIANMGVIKFTGNLLTNGTTVTNIPEKMKEGFLLSGGTVNKIPKYNSLGYLVDGSLIDNGAILETTKPIFKAFLTQGTAVTPVYDKIVYGGINSTNESGIYLGNSFGNNNGTYIKLSTNPTGTASSPNNAVIINPSGVVDFEQIPTAPTAPAGTNTTQVATTAFVQKIARPYKVYTALFSQSGINAPVATVLENTTGLTMTWSRAGNGLYSITPSTPFATNKAVVFLTRGTSGGFGLQLRGECGGNVVISQTDNSTGVDGLLNCQIEIRVYP